MTTAALTLALLRMGHPGAGPTDFARARILAATIATAARAHEIDPILLAAVAAHESTFHRDQVGRAGERGRWQVLPATARALGFRGSEAALAQDPLNAGYAAAWLAEVRAVCARHRHRGSLDAAALNAYRGAGCRTPNGRPSRYARQVLDLAAAGRAAAGAPRLPRELAAYWDRLDNGAASRP